MLVKPIVVALAVSPLAAQAASTFQRRDGAGGGHGGHGGGGHDHGAPQPQSFGGSAGGAGYAAPAPSSGYDQPSSGYQEPSSGYEQPAASYGGGGGGSGYGQVSSGYGDEGKDLSPIIIGILVLTGLSLLFPTYVSLTSVRRRKRDAEEGKQIRRNKGHTNHSRPQMTPIFKLATKHTHKTCGSSYSWEKSL